MSDTAGQPIGSDAPQSLAPTPEDALAAELLAREPTTLHNLWASISSVVVKETRWRMRGRRAFVIVTFYVSVLAVLLWLAQRSFEQSVAFSVEAGVAPPGFLPMSMSATMGQSIFSLVLVVQTLLTLALAPALTSGAISMEREKQTLEMLIASPVSTLGMVLGKLISSLAYVFLLVLASIPLMSLVFAFGGVAPDDVVRAYVYLFALTFGLGAIGLFMSALLKRTQLATGLAYVIVVMLTIGSFIAHTWLLATSSMVDDNGNFRQRTPPQFILLLNPLVADIDLACTAIPESYGFTCSYISTITGDAADPASPPRDAFWPRSAAAYILVGVVLTLATTQLISPSRRLGGQPPPVSALPAPAPPT